MAYMIKHPNQQLLNAPLPEPMPTFAESAIAPDIINKGGHYETFADIPVVKIEPKDGPAPAPNVSVGVASKKAQPSVSKPAEVSQAEVLKEREAEAAHKLSVLPPQQHPKLVGSAPPSPPGYVIPGFYYKGKFYPVHQPLMKHTKKETLVMIIGVILLVALGIALGIWLW